MEGDSSDEGLHRRGQGSEHGKALGIEISRDPHGESKDDRQHTSLYRVYDFKSK